MPVAPRSQSPGEGWAWFGDPNSDKGKWSIDTTSDVWSNPDQLGGAMTADRFKALDESYNTNYWTDQSQEAKIRRSLPGWWGFTGYDKETGAVHGYSRHSGGSGVISQGGDLTAEHYNQPGSWSVAWDRRPDGSHRNVVGDYWWEQRNQGKYTQDQFDASYAKPKAYLSSDPNYQTQLSEQKDRMRADLVKGVQEGNRTAADLYSWDKQHSGKDFFSSKHFTERFSEQDTATKRAQLAQQQQGVVSEPGRLETERANKGMTLAQRLKSSAVGGLSNEIAKIPIGAAGYGSGILASAFSGEQTNKTARKGDLRDFMDKNMNIPFQGMSGYQTPSDDWFYKGEEGTYLPHTEETRKQFPKNIQAPTQNVQGKFRFGQELASRGESLGQVTQESPFHDPEFHFDDPAYFNVGPTTAREAAVEADQKAWGVVPAIKGAGGTQYSSRNQPAPLPGRATPEILGMDAMSGTLPYSEWSPAAKEKWDARQRSFNTDFGTSIKRGELYKQSQQQQAKGSSWDQYLQRNVMRIPDISQGKQLYGKVDSLNAFPNLPTKDEFRRPNESYDDWGKRTNYGRGLV